MKSWRIPVLALGLACVAGAWLLAQDEPKLEVVKVTFLNTTPETLVVYTLDEDDSEKLLVKELKPQQSLTVDAYPGNDWRFKFQNVVIAEYEANFNPTQILDLTDLAAWQLPVTVAFENNTTNELDIVWRKDDGTAVTRVKGLRSGQVWTEFELRPGSDIEVMQGDKLVAEYLIPVDEAEQKVELKQLVDLYKAKVAVTFQNTTDKPVDIYWWSVDGAEELFIDNLQPGKEVKQITFPGHIWIIRQGSTRIGAYVTGDVRAQKCDIKEVVKAVSAQEKLLDEFVQGLIEADRKENPTPKDKAPEKK